MRAQVKPLGGSGVKNSGIPKVQQVPVPTIGKESLPTTDVSAPETTAGSGKTFLQKLGDVLSYNQKMDTASSAMAMGALLGNEQMQSTGQQMMQSNTENYLDSVEEFKYIGERAAGGATKGAENVVNALGYLGQMQNRAQIQQNAQTLGAWGALTGNRNFKGASEHMGNYAQELKDTGLQDTAKFGTKYQQGIQERYADADITKTGKTLGDVSETVGGLAPSAVMNVIAPGSGIVVSALSAGGNATQEALANGASDHEALAYGTAVGVIEAATEKIFDGMAGLFGKGAADDVIESMAKRLSDNQTVQTAFVKVANGLGEGFEEFLTEFATRITNELIIDTDNRSFMETLGDAGTSALMGMLVGGIVQTAGSLFEGVRSDPKALARQAANSTLAKIKGQVAAQQIDSMRKQLADMQRQRKVDALLAAYEKNVGAIKGSTDFDTLTNREKTQNFVSEEKIGEPIHKNTIDFFDENAVIKELDAARDEFAGFDHEESLTVTSDGKVWRVKGEERRVNPASIQDAGSALKGSYSYHNHPAKETNYSFSAADVQFFFEYGENYSKAADDQYEYVMIRTPETLDIDSGAAYNRFEELYKTKIYKLSWEGKIDIDLDGFHEVMNMLSQEYGFIYERRERSGTE